MGQIDDALAGHRVVAIDTCIWIYHLEQHPEYADAAGAVVAAVEQGRCRGVISELTLMELTVLPLKLGRQDIADEYELLLTNFPNLNLLPISREVLLQAAEIRSRYRLRTPDAIMVATALVAGASLLVGNDRSLKQVAELQSFGLFEIAR